VVNLAQIKVGKVVNQKQAHLQSLFLINEVKRQACSSLAIALRIMLSSKTRQRFAISTSKVERSAQKARVDGLS